MGKPTINMSTVKRVWMGEENKTELQLAMQGHSEEHWHCLRYPHYTYTPQILHIWEKCSFAWYFSWTQQKSRFLFGVEMFLERHDISGKQCEICDMYLGTQDMNHGYSQRKNFAKSGTVQQTSHFHFGVTSQMYVGFKVYLCQYRWRNWFACW